MPVTNYYTLDGGIVAERTDGARIDYFLDALGSVVRTFSEGQTREYRYKPYGGQLSASGSGSAPKFRWVGTIGYQPTGRERSEYYVRARHYGTEEGRWTTVDILLGQYTYASASVVGHVDPSGLIDYALGTGDPPINVGAGSGVWGSIKPSLRDRLFKSRLLTAVYAALLKGSLSDKPDAVKHLLHFYGIPGRMLGFV
jgi:RHS repeat-associated protein